MNTFKLMILQTQENVYNQRLIQILQLKKFNYACYNSVYDNNIIKNA
jgi:hypothetical protein